MKLDLAPFFIVADAAMQARLEVAPDRGNRAPDPTSAPDHLRDIASTWAAIRARHRIIHSASTHGGAFASARSVEPALRGVPNQAVDIVAALDCVRGLAGALGSAPDANEARAAVRKAAKTLTQIRDHSDPRVGRPSSPKGFKRKHDHKNVPERVRALSHAVATVESLALVTQLRRPEIVSCVVDLADDLVGALDRVMLHALESATLVSGSGDRRPRIFLSLLAKARASKVAFTVARAHDAALTLADADADGLDEAHAEAHALVHSSLRENITIRREMDAKLFPSHVAIVCADSPAKLMRARRSHAASFTEYIWTISEKLALRADAPGARRRGSRGTDAEEAFARQRETILALHWWFQALMARAEGMLPAWEGIRLVRERRSDSSRPLPLR